jgi:hypothetical protein
LTDMSYDASRSDVPEVATTPRSELGVFTPTFDSRSEVSAASNEPIASLSPRTDPSSPVTGEFDVPDLSLNGTLAPSTDPGIIAKSIPDGLSEATSEASVEPVPPSSPVQDITPLSTPTRQDSISESSAFFPSVQDAHATESLVPVDEAKLLDPASHMLPSEGLQSQLHPLREEATPRTSESGLLPEAEEDIEVDETESKTPSPPSWAIPVDGPKKVSQQTADATDVSHDAQALPDQKTRKSESAGPASRSGEYFPSAKLVSEDRSVSAECVRSACIDICV